MPKTKQKNLINTYEDVLINVFYYFCKGDYRIVKNTYGIYDDSLIHILSSKRTKEDFINVANLYYSNKTDDLKYRECEDLYMKLRTNYDDTNSVKKFSTIYNIDIDKNSLVVDSLSQLTCKYPDKNWKKDNLFLIKTLDIIQEKNLQIAISRIKKSKEQQKLSNISYLKTHKKLTTKEVLSSTNHLFIMSELNIPLEDAVKIATANYDDRMKNEIFVPYVPI